jgi:hypothetical protein
MEYATLPARNASHEEGFFAYIEGLREFVKRPEACPESKS